jgi:glycosyltransferase involved in cell wall biosynthesis
LINSRASGFPAYISAADLCLVMLKRTELFKTVIPTKLLEYMACERPVIVAVDGQARKIVEAAGAGMYTEAEDSRALARAILDLADCPDQRQKMGLKGRQYIIDNFSREKTARGLYHCASRARPVIADNQGTGNLRLKKRRGQPPPRW